MWGILEVFGKLLRFGEFFGRFLVPGPYNSYFPVNPYTQNLILVNLILVDFGGFLVIARNPPDGF